MVKKKKKILVVGFVCVCFVVVVLFVIWVRLVFWCHRITQFRLVVYVAL